MPIEHVSFIRPVSPLNGVDGTVPFIRSGDAELTLEGSFLRIDWKRAQGVYQLVPLTNVRELHCSDRAPTEHAPGTAPQPTSKPATAQPQSPAKAKAR